MIKTKNFNPLTDVKLLCTCGHADCDKRSVTQEVLNMLQNVRDEADRPLRVNSGGRCPKHPNERHRAIPADHQKGQGVDIACTGGIERGQLVTLGLKHGFNAIGVAKGFVHLGYRPDMPLGVNTFWTY